MRLAVTREISPAFASCELTHLDREPIDLALATQQHHAYEARLEELGYLIHRLTAAPDMPDSVFVEDAAIVLDELAIITRPGASSRRSETASIAEALSAFRELVTIDAPGTIDGGDVLTIRRTLYVGRSGRTNAAGRDQLRSHLEPFGYRVVGIDFRNALHLKSAVTLVAPTVALVNPDWLDASQLDALTVVEVHPREPLAANALLVGNVVVFPEQFHRTRERLETFGIPVAAVDTSEITKAEGGVTCCSLLFESDQLPPRANPTPVTP